jgi:hypothetical protein
MVTGTTRPYSGFDEVLKRRGPSGDTTTVQDLKWHWDINGDMQKIKQFQEVVGGLQDFRTYLLIQPGSAFLTVIHLPLKFLAISKATQHLQGRYVGFVGDHTATKDLTPVVLPSHSTWKWETKTMSLDAVALQAHYTADPTRRGRYGHQTRQTRTSGRQLRRPAYCQTRWSYGSRQLAVAGRSLDMVEPNPIHGQLLALV